MKNLHTDKKSLYKIIYTAVSMFFLIPIIITSVRLAQLAQNDLTETEKIISSEYTLMLTQSILGIISINIPFFLTQKYKFSLPFTLLILYDIFLFCSIYLGEVRKFYITIAVWDSILHCFSGVMLVFFGFMLVYIINRSLEAKDGITKSLSPFFIALFAFCFAASAGMLWEIYEFTFDSFLDLNMQKYRTDNGVPLSGREAVADTMKDIILDSIGALIASVVGYVSIKHKKGFVHGYLCGNADE